MKHFQSQAVAAKKVGKDCRCSLKCFERVTQERHENVFRGFWELGDWTAQNAFLCGSVKVTSVKRRYKKKDKSLLHSRRNYSRQYYININNHGLSIRVCKRAFFAIYAISNGRLSRALSKMQSVGSPQTDERGRHEPKNKHLKRMFSLCELTFKVSRLSQVIIVPTKGIFHQISP